MDNADNSEQQTHTDTPQQDTINNGDTSAILPDSTIQPEEASAKTPENLAAEINTVETVPAHTTPSPDETVSNEPAGYADDVKTPSTPARKSRKLLLLAIVLVVLGLAGVGTTGYILGNAKSKVSRPADVNSATMDKELTIPPGATVIAQCAKGRGTQYALPKDIPLGPVYNVSEGRVIGIEFMVGKDDLLTSAKSYLNLPLSDVKYDHVNIGLLSQGHAGFPTPHYHVDVMMVSTSVTDKITCT